MDAIGRHRIDAAPEADMRIIFLAIALLLALSLLTATAASAWQLWQR